MPPMSFNEPLLLREFFFTMASANPGLHKMDKNPLSVQYPWEENSEGLQRWKQASFLYICVVGFSADERFLSGRNCVQGRGLTGSICVLHSS